MTTTEELQDMEGQTAVDVNGAKLGKIGQVYVDYQTGQPLWVTISTGMFGTRQSFAPLYGSRPASGDLQLAVTKDMVTGAPGVEAVHLLQRVPRRHRPGPGPGVRRGRPRRPGQP